MKRIRQLVLMTVTLSILATATACLGITDSEHKRALSEQAQAAEQRSEVSKKEYADEIASKEAALEEATARATKTTEQIASLTKANTNVANQLEGAKQDIQSLVTRSDAATSEVNRLMREAGEETERTANARKESRWLLYEWTDENGDQARGVTTYAVWKDKTGAGIIGLLAECNGYNNFLYLVIPAVWDDETEYEVRVSFDGGRSRTETLWGFGVVSAAFEDLYGDDLWESETIQVGSGDRNYGEATFDTAQLKRMFPTADAFCNGATPRTILDMQS